MPIITYDTAATKKATNVSINADLLRQAWIDESLL